ncbi:MAG: amino acid permease [Planctomycetes bacterium]|nr:amino acid permease [Planctomycetota bacterium]
MAKNQLFAKKSLQVLMDEMAGEHRLHRVLGPITLTSLGIGSIIGTGIFVLVGLVAKDLTGPALMVSFITAGIACIFAALCYAEFASMAPVAGSAYTYAYTTLGELLAWIIGWDLVLEYAVAAATVAHGWSKYFQELLAVFGLEVPAIVHDAPFNYDHARIAVENAAGFRDHFQNFLAHFVPTGSILDLPALAITVALTVILVIGIRESAGFNAAMVMVKVAVVLFVIAVGAFYINPDNWTPFAPFGYSGVSFFGQPVWGVVQEGKPVGMLAGAAIIFFAYIGFDSVSTHAEEARNPRRDVPIAIIGSLLICTVLYILVAGVLTGMVNYKDLEESAPVADAFRQAGLPWARFVVSVGAIAGMTSVMLVSMLSQPRVLLAMARDGLLPVSFFGAVHPKFMTPWKATILTGVFVGLLGSFLPLQILAELVSIGTLLAFVIVCAAVLIMRFTNPQLERPFRAPLFPMVPLLGIASCLLLMFSLPVENWIRLGVWLAIGFAIYFGYSRHHSHLGIQLRQEIAAHGVTPGAAPIYPPTRPDDTR